MLVLIIAIQMIMSIVMLMGMGMGTRWVPATHGGYGYDIILYL
jgi:hypothetical protein